MQSKPNTFASCVLFAVAVCVAVMGALSVLLAAPANTAWAASTHHAILVGEENYSGGDYLRGALNDVSRMRSALTSLEGDPYDVVSLTDVSKSKVMSTIKSFQPGGSRAAKSTDVTLFYFSGHGMSGAKRGSDMNGALCCMNSSGTITNDNLISPSDLSAALKKVRGRIVILLDSCYSGQHASLAKSAGIMLQGIDESSENAAAELDEATVEAAADEAMGEFVSAFEDEFIPASDGISLMSANSKFYVMTSSSRTSQSMTFSVTRNGKKIHFGLFTFQLLSSMGFNYMDSEFGTSIPADKNADRKVSFAEAYALTSERVERYAPSMGSQAYPKYSDLVVFNRAVGDQDELAASGASPTATVLRAQTTAQTTSVTKPIATFIKNLTAGKKKFTVSWKAVTKGGVRGYQIRYSTKKSMAHSKKVLVKGSKTTKLTVKKLKSKKRYYVQIRSYKISNGKKVYSVWCPKKSVRVK